ncbi:DUF2490 domain-containing protein [bacterium]|nr:DUF2490 domain-containing protein [bacterium]
MNLWEYGNVTTLFSPNWAFVVMPGRRYEFSTTQDNVEPKGTFFYEFFAGPVYTHSFGDIKLKVPLWYYLMYFPQDEADDFYSHNIELLPIVEYYHGDWTFINRVILHNKIYADNSLFTSSEERSGYSLLLRELVRVNYKLSRQVSLTAADEVFLGLIEDSDTKEIATGEPFFAKSGFSRNRLYLGLNTKFGKITTLSTEYVWETNYDPDDDYKLTKIRHYIFLTATFVLKTF